METPHAMHITFYQCSIYERECNYLDNSRAHIKRKHQGEVTTKKATQYTLQEMSPEPIRPTEPIKNAFKSIKVPIQPYYQEPITIRDYT